MLDQNLNVDHPDKITAILRNAAQAAHEAAGELSSIWQDKSAGAPWLVVAKELERCADRIKARL